MIINGYILISLLFAFGVILGNGPPSEDGEHDEIVGSPSQEWRGYYKREHSLTKPYQSASMDIPYWDIIGSTIVSNTEVRLTTDDKSRRGGIFNKMPTHARDWEVHLTFKVTGSTGSLFGDGMAFWYVKEPQLGEVFGFKDYFHGLAVFLDTYSNHNGAHSHKHPYISAMVNNGKLHYDHDRDGTHTQLGGEDTGCSAFFRNQDFDTHLLIRYVGDILSVYTDVEGEGVWQKCFSVGGVHLPTGYHFGVSAATGDLSDNHDVISIKVFEQEFQRVEKEAEILTDQIEPRAEIFTAPRDHVKDPKPSKLGWIGTIFLILIAVAFIGVVLIFGVNFWQARQLKQNKRFY
ncbi:Legume-like lectin family and Concanavalin A-like lectin/glucanases superfamily domain and Concanavalin A-like lectin/glucanase, subgroup domain-containing protein [Strongyloides ratti]|uniref:Legume-like lectin family and Concanavalin A-like lectin/glucanases superfamily domain and Concanavalin A-like lectin/glucanase, subgroup domain-containing protein n=1 Tax=Strongyloides ratti TaxID=34506 RepID=A0A090KWY3_STRRB|nr:Legume-like lectin family and Concanavalin A-like lectin/glucanases superfamily domain and Concanavalin A-like lectin/glucanase, subgroup domain-containing protein [Strongyloides ratti]CEF60382.1 Legume-like lectin family and Concanavalin A-like lectin/glucanases superfamily domain and Concanavalin A-like lectin/glucanase, subgroup domain-containing protein [Strongyloides ratti]